MIKIAVCDDDTEFLSNTIKLLLLRAIKLSEVQATINLFNNGEDLLHEFENNNIYDIVILDIDMPLVNGKDLAYKLRNIDSTFCLAFMTAYKEEVFSTIPIGISAFIPKEFDKEACLESLTRLLKNYSQSKPETTFWKIVQNGVIITRRIPLNNVFYFQYCNQKIFLHTFSDSYMLTEKTFEEIAQKYISQGFYRSHRNYIINISRIFEVLDNEIVMGNGHHLPLSKRSRSNLFKELTYVISKKVE